MQYHDKLVDKVIALEVQYAEACPQSSDSDGVDGGW